jgi:hypothetical protein
MRQSELLQKLRFIKSSQPFTAHLIEGGTAQYPSYKLSRLGLLRAKLQVALEIPGLEESAHQMAVSPGLDMAGDFCTLDPRSFSKLSQTAQDIDMICKALIDYLQSVYGESIAEPNLVAIKLPIGNQLSTVSHAVQELDKILSQCLSILEEPSAVEIKGWESGSLWIDIALGSSIAVTCVGTLAWSSVCVLKKYRETQIIEKLGQANGIKNEMLGTIRDAMKESLNTVITAEAKRLDER